MPKADQSAELPATPAVIIAVFVALPLYYSLAHFGEPGRGEWAVIFVFGVTGAVLDSKRMWRDLWLWALVACLVLIHFALLAFVPWPVMDFDGQSAAGAALIDLLFCAGFIRLSWWLKKKVWGQPAIGEQVDR